MPLRRATHGFTIVELVIASAVLVLGLFAIYAEFLETRDRSQTLLIRAQARAIAHQKMCELLAASPESAKGWTGDAAFAPVEPNSRFHVRREAKAEADGSVALFVDLGWDPKDDAKQSFPAGQIITLRRTALP